MMTAEVESTLSEWQQAVGGLAEEVARWSREEGWSVEQSELEVEDERLGTYSVPALKIGMSQAGLRLEPLSHALDGTARVKFYAWPTLYRVRLQRRADGTGWVVWTDSGIPIHQGWNRENYLTLAKDPARAE